VRLRTWLLGGLVSVCIRLLGSTWRVRRVHGERLDEPVARGESVIVVFWHGEGLTIGWTHRHRGFAPLVSTHADGEIVARVVESLGYRTVRGSSTRGGMRALIEMARLLEEGVSVALTPDGPRGPYHVFSPGALTLARRTGRPIIALSADADRAWRLRSWDRYLVPKPFALVTIRYSEVQPVAGEVDAEARRFERLLGELAGAPNAT
jgi:lysophospholipid acyltransferase (LPLAT)-like uncharacterized protein